MHDVSDTSQAPLSILWAPPLPPADVMQLILARFAMHTNCDGASPLPAMCTSCFLNKGGCRTPVGNSLSTSICNPRIMGELMLMRPHLTSGEINADPLQPMIDISESPSKVLWRKTSVFLVVVSSVMHSSTGFPFFCASLSLFLIFTLWNVIPV